jgi:hypothetical protein
MATKNLSQLVGGDLHVLGPDLNFPLDKANGSIYVNTGTINATGSLTTILSLTGKFLIENLSLNDLIANNIAQIKLTVDGVVVWNVDPVSNSTAEPLIGKLIFNTDPLLEHIGCESSFLLEMQMDSDTDISLLYVVRPLQ